MKLYQTQTGLLAETEDQRCYALGDVTWSELLRQPSPLAWVRQCVGRIPAPPVSTPRDTTLLPPMDAQEVWAAGVTYERSRNARKDESATTGASAFYDRVYDAPRPELFFKALRCRVAGHGQTVRIPRGSRWTVPEPELTLVINAAGRVVGYTVGNDMSARDIEAENPLYLPQAKIYDGGCALGPCVLLSDQPLADSTTITLVIWRDGAACFQGATTLARLKRTPGELVDFLYADRAFPAGCFLMTGTGIVPPDDVSLQPGDEIRITIDSIGTLINQVGS